MSDLTGRPRAGRVFEGTRRVRLADVSPAGRLRLDAIARFLQDVSADDTADAALPDAEAWVVRITAAGSGDDTASAAMPSSSALAARTAVRILFATVVPLVIRPRCSGHHSAWLSADGVVA